MRGFVERGGDGGEGFMLEVMAGEGFAGELGKGGGVIEEAGPLFVVGEGGEGRRSGVGRIGGERGAGGLAAAPVVGEVDRGAAGVGGGVAGGGEGGAGGELEEEVLHEVLRGVGAQGDACEEGVQARAFRFKKRKQRKGLGHGGSC
jgi:hypothetical protein